MMKHAKIILSSFSFGFLFCLSITPKTSLSANAWQSFKPEDLESTFISEEQDAEGLYHYKYQIKNVGQFYIYDFYISGDYQIPGEDFTRTQMGTFNVKNELFDYKSLLIGPQQNVDVDFCVNEKYQDIDKVVVYASGYYVDESAKIANDAYLNSDILTLRDSTVNLSFDKKDQDYDYCAILKANINNETYYFAAEEKNNYHVYGNYVNRCNDDIKIELVTVVKIRKGETLYTEKENPSNVIGKIFLFLITFPFIITIGAAILVSVIIAICVIVALKVKKHNKSKEN